MILSNLLGGFWRFETSFIKGNYYDNKGKIFLLHDISLHGPAETRVRLKFLDFLTRVIEHVI